MNRLFLSFLGLFVSIGIQASNYLCFTANEDGSMVGCVMESSRALSCAIESNGVLSNWQLYTSGAVIVLEKKGDKVYWSGNNPYGFGEQYRKNHFIMKGSIAASGSVMSLIDEVGESTVIPRVPYCFFGLFSGCDCLTQAPELPATELGYCCYYSMFADCKSLTKIPELPAEDLSLGYGERCYAFMFAGCTGLTEVEELPAKVLSSSCYCHMFDSCVNLVKAPVLPATYSVSGCYEGMFYGCTSLTQAPELPAAVVEFNGYKQMFSGCVALTQAPKLPSSSLGMGCYEEMFSGCTSLTQAPELPVSWVKQDSYRGMFAGCTSLTQAPELPATRLDYYCYDSMFSGCTSLTRAPELPAVYFHRSEITDLNDTVFIDELSYGCYDKMFSGCENLSYIKVATPVWGIDSVIMTNGWVENVSATGTFICPAALEEKYGIDYIPEGWSLNGNSVNDYFSPINGILFSCDGHLFLSSSESGNARIFNIGGELLKSVAYEIGETDLGAFPAGVYVVNGQKVVVK